MSTSPTSFVWYELMTSDPEAAEAFYRAVVGWTARDAGQPNMRYTLVGPGETMVAGIMATPEEARAAGMPPSWFGYIATGDVDATTAAVRQAGGAVHREPSDIPGIGRFSVVADPQGATFMLIQPTREDAPPLPYGAPGTIGWRELYAADWTSAFDFYSTQFGWTKTDAVDMGPMGIYQTFASGKDMIGGMMNKPAGIPSPVWIYYFIVDGIDSAIARVQDHGGRILNGPHPVPGDSWIVQCLDPQGAMFALVAPRR